MLAKPVLQIEVVVLLGPEHPRQRLAVDAALILAQSLRCDPLVEFVGLGDPPVESSLEPAEGIVYGSGRETQPDGLAAGGGHVEHVVGCGLRPDPGGVHGVRVSRDDVGVERILDVGSGVGLAPQTVGIALVLGEEQLGGAIAPELVLANLLVRDVNGTGHGLSQ